jgi:hypothetical protein
VKLQRSLRLPAKFPWLNDLAGHQQIPGGTGQTADTPSLRVVIC